MKYRKGFKYQLAEQIMLETSFQPKEDIYSDFCHLLKGGNLILKKGFAWDGPSGPVIDRDSNMRASAGHDGLYRLMRKGVLDHYLWPQADLMFAKWLKEDESWGFIISIDMLGLKIAKGKAAHPDNKSKVYQV